MSETGSLFGWLIVAGLAITLLNYPIKAIYRKWISHLDKESGLRRAYSKVQAIIVKYHRFFAMFTTAMMIIHLLVQLQYRWLSWTGLVAAALMVINGFLGGYGHFIKKKRKSAWLYIHRTVAALLIVAIFIHIYTNAR